MFKPQPVALQQGALRLDPLTEADLPGLLLEFRKQENGPKDGKPVNLKTSASDPAQALAWADHISD